MNKKRMTLAGSEVALMKEVLETREGLDQLSDHFIKYSQKDSSLFARVAKAFPYHCPYADKYRITPLLLYIHTHWYPPGNLVIRTNNHLPRLFLVPAMCSELKMRRGLSLW